MVRYLICVVLFSLALFGHVQGQSADFRKAVRELNEKSGILSAITNGGVESVIDSLKEAYPDVEANYWLKRTSEMEKSAYDEVSEYLVITYAEHFSLEEIRMLVEFYETPEGRKWASLMPVLASAHEVAGIKWRQSLFARTIADLEKKGY